LTAIKARRRVSSTFALQNFPLPVTGTLERSLRENDMLKIASLVWMVLATTLAGIAIIAIVAVPSLAEQAMLLIPVAVVAGVVLAIPLSYLVARKMQDSARSA
jgi:positive regulator of sigma E activity